nr:PREDICTED: odorant receptor 22b-like [Megachile rotundata]
MVQCPREERHDVTASSEYINLNQKAGRKLFSACHQTRDGNSIEIRQANRNLIDDTYDKNDMAIFVLSLFLRSSSKAYTAILMSCLSCIIITVFVIGFTKRMLICRIWVPYNYSSTSLYIVTSMYEGMGACYGISASSACECLYTGLLLHICCQFEILEHRFRSLNSNPIYTANHCASHHHLIYKYAEAVNEEFRGIMSFQFFSSMSILCLTIYHLAYAENSAAFMATGLYMTCVLCQMFYYCFYGDMVKTKSIEFIDKLFQSGWASWNGSSKMVLLMVMRRSRTPIEFTSMHIVTLNLESFMSLLRTSYSAFNLMSSTR